LAVCYETGRGTTADFTKAYEFYQKSAQLKNPGKALPQFFFLTFQVAEQNVGLCYYYGRGVTKNHIEAAKWFKKSAENDCQ
jgi:TPR repeat protein